MASKIESNTALFALAYGRSRGLPIVITRRDDVSEPNQFP